MQNFEILASANAYLKSCHETTSSKHAIQWSSQQRSYHNSVHQEIFSNHCKNIRSTLIVSILTRTQIYRTMERIQQQYNWGQYINMQQNAITAYLNWAMVSGWISMFTLSKCCGCKKVARERSGSNSAPKRESNWNHWLILWCCLLFTCLCSSALISFSSWWSGWTCCFIKSGPRFQ